MVERARDREGKRERKGKRSTRGRAVRRNPHIPVEGESVQLLELVKACYTSKCARDYVLELSDLVKGLSEPYTRNVQ